MNKSKIGTIKSSLSNCNPSENDFVLKLDFLKFVRSISA